MEILRNKLLKFSIVQNMNPIEQHFKNTVEDIFNSFIYSMFDIISKYDNQLMDICETVRMHVI